MKHQHERKELQTLSLGLRRTESNLYLWHFRVLQINLWLCITSVGQENTELCLWYFITSFRERWARGWADEQREQPRAAPASPWAAPPPPGHSSLADLDWTLPGAGEPRAGSCQNPSPKGTTWELPSAGKTQDVQLQPQLPPAWAVSSNAHRRRCQKTETAQILSSLSKSSAVLNLFPC